MWGYIAIIAISLIFAYVFAPKTESKKPAGLGDINVPTAEVGRKIPVLFGTRKLFGPNVVWYGDLTTKALTQKTGLGGRVTYGYRYNLGMQMVLCHGPIDKITRIQVDDKDAWVGNTTGGVIQINSDSMFGGNSKEGGISGAVSIAMGGPTQAQDSYLLTKLGPTVPHYRGVVSVILRNTYIGTSPYLKAWSFWATRIAVLSDGNPQWYLAKANINGDLNPAHIIRECLTDVSWGLGYPLNSIDDVSFAEAADVLFNESLGLSMLWDTEMSINEFIEQVLKPVEGSLAMDRLNGKWQLKLMRAVDDTGTLPSFDEDSIESFTEFKRPSTVELHNSVTVSFWDKDTGKDNSITVQDIALSSQQGFTTGVTRQMVGVTNGVLAAKLASRELKTLSTPLATGSLTLNRRASNLSVGDLFKVSWSPYSLSNMIFRAIQVDLGSTDSRKVKVKVVEDVFYLGQSTYSAPDSAAWVPPGVDPEPVDSTYVEEMCYYDMSLKTPNYLASIDNGGWCIQWVATRNQPESSEAESWVITGSGSEQYDTSVYSPRGTIIGHVTNLTPTSANLVFELEAMSTILAVNNVEGLELFESYNGTFAILPSGGFSPVFGGQIPAEILKITNGPYPASDFLPTSHPLVALGCYLVHVERGFHDTIPSQPSAATSPILFYQNALSHSEKLYEADKSLNVYTLGGLVGDPLLDLPEDVYARPDGIYPGDTTFVVNSLSISLTGDATLYGDVSEEGIFIVETGSFASTGLPPTHPLVVDGRYYMKVLRAFIAGDIAQRVTDGQTQISVELPTVYAEPVAVKSLTVTSKGTLALSDAVAAPLGYAARASCPVAPSNVKINGRHYPNNQVQVALYPDPIVNNAPITISWTHRNRKDSNTRGFLNQISNYESGVRYVVSVNSPYVTIPPITTSGESVIVNLFGPDTNFPIVITIETWRGNVKGLWDYFIEVDTVYDPV
jgi:hypothetical protein